MPTLSLDAYTGPTDNPTTVRFTLRYDETWATIELPLEATDAAEPGAEAYRMRIKLLAEALQKWVTDRGDFQWYPAGTTKQLR